MSYIAPYSPREEFANAFTLGVGFLVAVAALVHMINVAPLQLSVWQKTGVVFKAFFTGRFKWISV